MVETKSPEHQIRDAIWTYGGWAVLLGLTLGAGIALGYIFWGDAIQLRATNTELLLIDEGFPPVDVGTSWRELGELAGCAARPVMRIEQVAERVGIALGLVNLYLRRLSRKGYVKITEFPTKPAARKRLRYLLTAKGLTEKSRLTYEHMLYSLHLFRRTRETLRGSLALMAGHGMKRVALYGPGEAAELAYLTLKEFELEPLGIYASRGGGTFLGIPVKPVAELADESLDAVVIATFDRPEPHVAELVGFGVAPAKILTLRVPAPGSGVRRA